MVQCLISEPVRTACSDLYENIQHLYYEKLIMEGYSNESAATIALLITALIEGTMMFCLTKKSSTPLKTISTLLPTILKTNT